MLWIMVVVTHTPLYVWLCLAVFFVLGVRRLKPRRTHLGIAALAPCFFILWSFVTATFLALSGDPWGPALTGGAGLALGVLSSPIRTVARPRHVGGWRFDFAATAAPLTLYMLLFALHYGLGIWAAFAPALADSFGLVRLLLSATTAGRTLADFVPLLLHARHPEGSLSAGTTVP